MLTVEDILLESGVHHEPLRDAAFPNLVYLSDANQLLGTYRALKQFRSANYGDYGGRPGQPTWEVHHIFEDRQLNHLGVRSKFPDKERCLCVLIPAPAHRRLNSSFSAHTRQFTDVPGILLGYQFAHAAIGDYSGAIRGKVSSELDDIVRAAFRCAGLVA